MKLKNKLARTNYRKFTKVNFNIILNDQAKKGGIIYIQLTMTLYYNHGHIITHHHHKPYTIHHDLFFP